MFSVLGDCIYLGCGGLSRYIQSLNTENATVKPHLQTINSSQHYIQKYEDLKRKLYNCNANIYFSIYNKLPDDLAELVLSKKRFLLQLKKYLT